MVSNCTKDHWQSTVYVNHLELKRFFDIDLLVNEENAQEIWDQANKCLATPEFKRREIAKNAHVKVICTTDIPSMTSTITAY